MELSRKMLDLGLTEMDVPDEEPVPTADELAFDWIGHFTETLPRIRNNYAHGSSSLHTTVQRTFEVTRTFINQLFVGTPAVSGSAHQDARCQALKVASASFSDATSLPVSESMCCLGVPCSLSSFRRSSAAPAPPA